MKSMRWMFRSRRNGVSHPRRMLHARPVRLFHLSRLLPGPAQPGLRRASGCGRDAGQLSAAAANGTAGGPRRNVDPGGAAKHRADTRLALTGTAEPIAADARLFPRAQRRAQHVQRAAIGRDKTAFGHARSRSDRRRPAACASRPDRPPDLSGRLRRSRTRHPSAPTARSRSTARARRWRFPNAMEPAPKR